MTFICSDPHFGHSKIEEFEPSRGAWREKHSSHEEFLIDNWNSAVTNEDTVLCLGDFSWDAPSKYIQRLNGRKVLVLGNHDNRGDQAYDGMEVIRGIVVIIGGVKMRLESNNPLVSAIIYIKEYEIEVYSHYALFFADDYDNQRQGLSTINSAKKVLEDTISKLNINNLPIINIHGHLHSKQAKHPKVVHINVSMENINFTPTETKELEW